MSEQKWDVKQIREWLGKTAQDLELAGENARNLEAGLQAHRVDVLTQQQKEISRLKRQLRRTQRRGS